MYVKIYGKMARTLMVQGTGSHVGKSLLVTALCRIFTQDGYRVAPFKAQNMALNSFVTRDGGEIGRAQATQAEAAGIEPTVDMNPILLKPTTDLGAQVVVKGKVVANMEARRYHRYRPELLEVVKDSFHRLSNEYDIVVIEGAGSPAEVNLRGSELVNMKMAEIADSPVIIVGDIDLGGVFAWLVGTLELLTPMERERVKGVIINKFRGDIEVLRPGLLFLEERIQRPILGVIPYIDGLRIAQEDSMGLERAPSSKRGRVCIDVLCLPHISNFTDFDPLENEPDVNLRYIRRGDRVGSPDCLIIPGTKNTVGDLLYLKRSGYVEAIFDEVRNGTLVGICGGYQMLGMEVKDPHGMETRNGRVEGFGILPIITTMRPDKVTHQIEADDLLFASGKINGYEIHKGDSSYVKAVRPAFKIMRRSEVSVDIEDGAVLDGGRVWGTYIHGLFDNDEFRKRFIDSLKGDGVEGRIGSFVAFKEMEYDRLATLVRANLDMETLYNILFWK
jgi:adenosylcobyric acid synthase